VELRGSVTLELFFKSRSSPKHTLRVLFLLGTKRSLRVKKLYRVLISRFRALLVLEQLQKAAHPTPNTYF
jgi:hypothetical protein